MGGAAGGSPVPVLSPVQGARGDAAGPLAGEVMQQGLGKE